MFDWLSPHDGHVFDDLQDHEVVFAEEQPEYIPLRALRSRDGAGRVLSRWTPTEEQRAAIAAGADVFLELVTFGAPLQPIRIAISEGSTLDAAQVAEEFCLPI
jgi:hypothetical protein